MYAVSDCGLILSWCNSRHPRKKTPVLLGLTKLRSGHMSVDIRRRKRLVHHLVLEAFVGPRPMKKECRHLNGMPGDNRLSNLVWGTRRENIDDRVLHGISNRNKGKKITPKQAISIKASTDTQRNIAKKYGIAQATVSQIKTGVRWKFLLELEKL